jgi:5-methylcytosine-specific restriction endonuclease McrA
MESDEQKLCLVCTEVKPFGAYHKRAASKDGLYSTCKECRKLASKQYYGDNKEKVKTKNKKYYKDNVDRVKNRVYSNRDREPEKYRDVSKRSYEKRKEDILKYKKEYYDEHSGAIKEKAQARRQTIEGKLYSREYHRRKKARRSNNLNYEKVDYQKIACRDKHTCYLCGKIFDGVLDICFDHIIPESKGGAHRYSNVASSCFKCNSSKHAKMPEQLDPVRRKIVLNKIIELVSHYGETSSKLFVLVDGS